MVVFYQHLFSVVVEIIENPVSSNEEEILEDEDEDDINEEPGISNFEVEENFYIIV